MSKNFNKELKKARGINVDGLFYADTYQDNIYNRRMEEKYIRMFCKGEGKELLPKDGKKEKAACIYSSSMLAYNFFSWIGKNKIFEYDGIKYNKVVFEEQFRVLKNRNNRANLDVVLVSEDKKTIMLLESKFTEHFAVKDSVPDISDAYDSIDSYFENCYGSNWVKVIKRLREMPKERQGQKAYYEGLKQVVCHLIGISNVIKDPKARKWFNNNSWLSHLENIELKGDEIFIFKSIVFHPKTDKENRLSSEYEELNKEFVESLDFLPTNLKTDNPIITYRQLWEKGMIDSIVDEDLKDYLMKYLDAHVETK